MAFVEPSASTCLAPWQARRVTEFVEANLTDTIRIADLAGLARLSIRHFHRSFVADFGESPYTYVTRRRVDKAKEMMLATTIPLASIALACGFSDQAHLTRFTRRMTGRTPKGWRRQAEKEPVAI